MIQKELQDQQAELRGTDHSGAPRSKGHPQPAHSSALLRCLVLALSVLRCGASFVSPDGNGSPGPRLPP